jgi:hypothetical protein
MLDSSNYYKTQVIPCSIEEEIPMRLEWFPDLKKSCLVPDYTKQKPIRLINYGTIVDYTKLNRR